MANVKISQLPAVTVPLAGTEELPVVQGGVTKRTAINNILNANTIPYIANGLGAVATPSYTFTGDLNTGMWSPAADTLAFSEGGAEAMRITSAGNVGIGTTTPAVKLDVSGDMNVRNIETGFGLTSGEVAVISLGSGRSGDGDTSIGFYYTALAGQADAFLGCAVDGASATLQFNFGNNSANGDINFSTAAGTGAVITRTNGSERMRVTSAGNVGIGTSAPTSLLDVNGNTEVAGTLFLGASNHGNLGSDATQLFVRGNNVALQNAAGSATYVYVNTSGNVGIGTSAPGAKLDVVGSGSVYTRARSTDTTGSAIGHVGAEFAGGSVLQMRAGFGYTYLVSTGASDPLLIGTNSNERMRIDSSGNVMVGTTSATGLFSVNGVSYGAMIATDRFGLLGNNLYYGTANFRYIGNGHAYGWVQGNTDGADYRLLYAGNNTSGGGAVATPTERLYITAAGNVGIGTASPGSTLTVSGTVNFTGALTSGDLADAVGYKGLPQNAKTASYTLALSDMGKHISITTGGVVIPANGSVAFPIGSTIVIYNDSASAQNISITTDTLRLAGTATTGTRSLAQRGLSTCVKVLATEWVVSGNVT